MAWRSDRMRSGFDKLCELVICKPSGKRPLRWEHPEKVPLRWWNRSWILNNKESARGRGNTPAGFQVGVSVSGKQTVTTSEMTLDTVVSSALRLIGHKGTVSICRSCLSSAHFLSRKWSPSFWWRPNPYESETAVHSCIWATRVSESPRPG